MVYRGKPSAGCENCRKAKKRCGLEQPACSRCVKLKKTCTGYRDTNALQIQDETVSVTRKAERQNAKSQTPSQSPPPRKSNSLAPPEVKFEGGMPTPTTSDSTSSSESTIDIDPILFGTDDLDMENFESSLVTFDDSTIYDMNSVPMTLLPRTDDIATNYFFEQFTSNNHWNFMRSFTANRVLDPCLELSMKACGMAALGNVQNVVMGKDYAQSKYVEALGLLNDALRDPKRCRTDEALIAVAMLGYYENLTCSGMDSIQSWKAHVKGATQLLKLRGKSQFKTSIGRTLFRETRNQIIIHSIWDDEAPPDFLWEYQAELTRNSEKNHVAIPVDSLTSIIFDFASLRSKIRYCTIDDLAAAEQASEIEKRIIQWQIETPQKDQRWAYYEMEVESSDNVWANMVHSYWGLPAPQAWNTLRSIRAMLTRTQEMLCRRLTFSDEEREEQMQYFNKQRRQLTDEICATVPVMLGNASPAFNSPCVLITAYAAIWPLFFAGTCALERVGPGGAWVLDSDRAPAGHRSSQAAAQAQWIMSQLEYISTHIGLRWADGILAILRGEFKVPEELLQIDDQRRVQRYSKLQRAHWLMKIEEARRGAKYLIEKPSPLKDAMTEELAKNKPPIWLGRAVKQEMQEVNWSEGSVPALGL